MIEMSNECKHHFVVQDITVHSQCSKCGSQKRESVFDLTTPLHTYLAEARNNYYSIKAKDKK